MGKRSNFISFLIGGICLLLFHDPADATLISGSVTGGQAFDQGSQFFKLSVPLSNPFGPVNSVGNNTFQNINLFGFDENQNIDLTDFLNLGLGVSLPSNIMTLASHYVFYDPYRLTTLLASVEFANDIVAVMTTKTALFGSESLGEASVTYLYPDLVGLEPRDSITFQKNKLFLDWRSGTPGDYIRVITAEFQTPVPEPSTFALFGFGLVGLGLFRRRKQPCEV